MYVNGERTMAWIATIDEVEPIPDADKIVAYRIGGWWVVDQKEKYVVGDLVIYCSIDSFIPTPVAPFLTKPGNYPKVYNEIEGERVRTIRLRGRVSQGLILPLSVLPQNELDWNDPEGYDVTELLNIQKWEVQLSAQLSGLAKGSFPFFGRKTDQERIENCENDVFVRNAGAEYEISMKLDGSSCSVYYNVGTVGVCSRNLELKIDGENAGNTFIVVAQSSGLLTALESYKRNIMVSSELMGPNIQNNKEKLSTHELFVFDIYDIDAQRYVGSDERMQIMNDLRELGFTGKHVPIIHSNVTLESIGVTDVASSKVFVDKPSLNSPIVEGYVFKRLDGGFSFKSINNKFLLKFE